MAALPFRLKLLRIRQLRRDLADCLGLLVRVTNHPEDYIEGSLDVATVELAEVLAELLEAKGMRFDGTGGENGNGSGRKVV